MKKSIAILLAMTVIITSMFVACKKKPDDNGETQNNPASSTEQSIMDGNTDFGFEEVPVTDEKGKEVTDKSGQTVTTEVAVIYVVDKKGKTIAKVLDKNGDVVTDKHGKDVTIDTDVEITTRGTTQTQKTTSGGKGNNTTSGENEKSTKKGEKTTKGKDGNNESSATRETNATTSDETTESTETTTVESKKTDQTTEPEITTKKNVESVPKTSDSGERVSFSVEDQQIIKNILEVPYLYVASYENSDGVPINAASHAAIWMLKREGISTDSYAAGTVVIDLFKYYGQTVINFKSRLTSEGDNNNIIYYSNTDTFVVRAFEDKAQEVTIDHFESFGYGNYYKVVGTVTDAGKYKKVVAIIQRNRLDNSLGFSLKAVKWS